jgi:hypothetical protein
VFTLLPLSPMTEAVSVSFCSVSAENLAVLAAFGRPVLSMETLQTTTRRHRAELFESEDHYIDNILRVNEIRELAMNGGFIEPAIPQVGQVQPLNAVL